MINNSLHSFFPITPAPSTAALALLSTTSFLRGATAPIRCYESIQTLASANNCKSGCMECVQGDMVSTKDIYTDSGERQCIVYIEHEINVSMV